MVFNVGGDDVEAFFPVQAKFVGQGSLAGVEIESVQTTTGDDEVPFSVDATVVAEKYTVV